MGPVISFCQDCLAIGDDHREYLPAASAPSCKNVESPCWRDEKVQKECSKALVFYSLGKCVAQGATSRVYQVARKYRPRSERFREDGQLACKFIDKKRLIGLTSADVEMDSILGQLRKEIAILKSIDHPNIISFHDFIETKDAMFLITEYAEGEELFGYLNRKGPMSEDLTRQVMKGVFSAVSYLHDQGVLHRDIKTENVMIKLADSPTGRGPAVTSVKLIDFGFSTMLRRTDVTGSFLGTGGYLAPEIRQQRLYGASIDNWALGTLLYCTISGTLPFGSEYDALPRHRYHCEKVFALRMDGSIWAKVSRDCKDLIRKLLGIDPVLRLTSRQALWHPWFVGKRSPRRGSNGRDRTYTLSYLHGPLKHESSSEKLQQWDSFSSNVVSEGSQDAMTSDRGSETSGDNWSNDSLMMKARKRSTASNRSNTSSPVTTCTGSGSRSCSDGSPDELDALDVSETGNDELPLGSPMAIRRRKSPSSSSDKPGSARSSSSPRRRSDTQSSAASRRSSTHSNSSTSKRDHMEALELETRASPQHSPRRKNSHDGPRPLRPTQSSMILETASDRTYHSITPGPGSGPGTDSTSGSLMRVQSQAVSSVASTPSSSHTHRSPAMSPHLGRIDERKSPVAQYPSDQMDAELKSRINRAMNSPSLSDSDEDAYADEGVETF